MLDGRVYADHAATSPMLPEVRDAWTTASRVAGNPSSLHASGRAARRIVEEARESIAAALHARPSSVIFTSGGTEADNLAVKGLFWAARDRGDAPRVLASSIEHHAVLDPVEWLAKHEGADVTWIPVDSRGLVDPAWIAERLDRLGGDAALCTVMWANNEIGSIQPVQDIARICRDAGVPFHTDAVQVLGQVPIDITALGASAVTISSHKVGGPVGIGALIIDIAEQFTPVVHGGGQEREIRSGTLDCALASGFAAAVESAVTSQHSHAERMRALQESLITGVRSAVPDAILNGGEGVMRLPGNVHFTFPGCEGDALLMLLDAAGIDCSTGSACTAGIPEPSHVLLATGVPDSLARSSLRFSLGRTSSDEDVSRIVAALPAAVDRAKRAGSSTRSSAG